MSSTSSLQFFTSTDRALLGAAMAGILVCSYLLYDHELLNKLIGQEILTSKAKSIGRISFTDRDTRHKVSQTFAWQTAKSQDELRLGDGVFTGADSHMRVELLSGEQIDLDQQTLILFSRVDGIEVPNLSTGNFRLKVGGKLKVAIAGQMVEIEGKDSEVQIVVDKNHGSRMKLLSGEAKIRTAIGQKTIQLQKNTFATIETPPLPLALIPEPPPQISPQPTAREFSYTYKLEDVYERHDASLEFKKDRNEIVHLPVQLTWEESGPVDTVYVENAKEKGESFISEAHQSGLNLTSVFLGLNIWKISLDQKNWSETNRFTVNPVYLSPTPKLKNSERTIALNHKSVDAQMSIEGSFLHYIAEVSSQKDFAPERTKIQILDTPVLPLALTEPGCVSVRVRGVDERSQITNYSNVETVTVALPKAPETPVLAQTVPLTIERQLATAQSVLTLRSPTHFGANALFGGSYLEFASGLVGMYSREEIMKSGVPTIVDIAVRLHQWIRDGVHGIAAAISVKAVGLENGADTNPLDAEAGYLHRWALPWNLFSRSQDSQIYSILGFETHRNSGAGLFSPSYDLGKLGFGLIFPFADHWDTGGELVYGLGFDGSHAYQISGQIHYFLRKDWALGAGYKALLFEAGGASSAPTGIGVPYREAFGSAYSSLTWHY